MNEADLKRGLVHAFNDLGDRVFAFRTETNVIGLPDLIANRAPCAAWIEVKFHRTGQTKWKLTALQRLFLGKLDGYLVTYVQEKDRKRVKIDSYSGLAHVRWYEIQALNNHGWPKIHELVARHIATARLRY